MAQFTVKRELRKRELYAYFVVYAGTLEIASFPSPEFTYTGRGQLQNKANPLYGKEAPTTHAALPHDAYVKLWRYVTETRKGKNPLMPLEIYDIFYTRNNG